MALIQMNLLSQSLMRTVPVNVILPADKMLFPGMKQREDKPYQTLYLLHGVFGNYTDWITGTRIQRYAQEHDLAVVMPSGDNAFYLDHPRRGDNYGEFIGKELVSLTRKIFPLSKRREDTFIGGLSMGGYGALRNGLKYQETFGYILVLSSALVLEEAVQRTEDDSFLLNSKAYAQECFGNLEQALESDVNPKYIVKQLKKQGAPLPKIYMACGSEDGLKGVNREFASFLKENGAEVFYEEGPGGHDWDFWDAYIKKGIEWLPAEENGSGMNSGNVGL